MSVLRLDILSIGENPDALSGGVLQGLPQVDQLNEPTADHAADENARMNCVFTSNAAVSRKVGGHPEANGDAIKDGCSHYGQGYRGGADETVLASDGCLDAKWGIHATTVQAENRSDLIAVLQQSADAGHFALVTIPSMWGSQPQAAGYDPDHPNFFTHVCVYCGYFGDTHVLMNPWGGFLMYYSTADLQVRLCYLKVYPITPVAAQVEKPMIVFDFDATTGALTGAHDADKPKLTVRAGFAQAIHDRNFASGSITVPETDLPGGESICVLRGGARVAMTSSAALGVKLYGDDVVLAFQDLYNELQAAKNVPVPVAPPAPPPVDNRQAILDLNAIHDQLAEAVSTVQDAVVNLKATIVEVK